MNTNSINNLSQKLEELNERFKNNLESLMIIKNVKDEDTMSETSLNGVFNPKKSSLERLKLINENFNINKERLKLYEIIKENQSLIFNKYFSEENQDLTDRTYMEEWILHYSLLNDSQMVQILQNLRN